MLEFNFNWDKLSVSAGLTLRNFYFRLYPGAIGELEVIDFLKALVRHIDGPLLIVWDRLPAHRSRLVREFIQLSEDHIATEYLPPYAPELNPVEYIWAYWKQHELPNVCPKDYWELDERARKALRRMRRKPRLITAFWKQSSLCLVDSILCETQQKRVVLGPENIPFCRLLLIVCIGVGVFFFPFSVTGTAPNEEGLIHAFSIAMPTLNQEFRFCPLGVGIITRAIAGKQRLGFGTAAAFGAPFAAVVPRRAQKFGLASLLVQLQPCWRPSRCRYL